MTGAERLSIIAHARDVAADLMGTCRDPSDFAHEAELDDLDFCHELDSHVELCEECGWWREPGEWCCYGEDDELDLANALEVSEAVTLAQAKRHAVLPIPAAKTCPHGFIDWDFCPECCH